MTPKRLIDSTEDDLRSIFREIVREELNEVKPKEQKFPREPDDIPTKDRINAEQAYTLCNVSEKTFIEWKKLGIITAYGVGKKKWYDRQQCQASQRGGGAIQRKRVKRPIAAKA